MKTKIILLSAIALCFSFTSCSDDDNEVTVSKTYHMYLGLGEISKTGTDAPAITALQSSVETAVAGINRDFTDITVTGKGKDEAAALENAKQQAISTFDVRAEAVYVSMINIKANFELARTAAAAEIVEEDGYYSKLSMILYLRESTGDFDEPIVKQSEPYYMEAIGGEDYSADNQIDVTMGWAAVTCLGGH